MAWARQRTGPLARDTGWSWPPLSQKRTPSWDDAYQPRNSPKNPEKGTDSGKGGPVGGAPTVGPSGIRPDDPAVR